MSPKTAVSLPRGKPSTEPPCQVQLDRVVLAACADSAQLPDFPGFARRSDRFVRPQTPITTYRRAASYECERTGTRIYLQHSPAPPWLSPIKLSIIANDATGLRYGELSGIVRRLRASRLLSAEFAFDFSRESPVGRAFILKHAVFGRSQLARSRTHPYLRFGGRKSEKLVRVYDKQNIRRFRVELELHSSFFRRYEIESLDQFFRLSSVLFPSHFRFVRLDWTKLNSRLEQIGRPLNELIRELEIRRPSITQLCSYLRRELKLANAHRFLQPLAINTLLGASFDHWLSTWESAGSLRSSMEAAHAGTAS